MNTHWANGALFENMVIADMMKNYFNRAQVPALFFWRDNTGNELDCLIDEGSTFKSVEIKSSSTVSPAFFKGLKYYNALSDISPEQSFLIYGGAKESRREEGRVLGWQDTTRLIS